MKENMIAVNHQSETDIFKKNINQIQSVLLLRFKEALKTLKFR